MNAKQKFLSNLKNNAANVMSAPSRAYQGMRGDRYDSERGVLKQARAYDNAPNFDDRGVTDAFKTRSMADSIRQRRMGK